MVLNGLSGITSTDSLNQSFYKQLQYTGDGSQIIASNNNHTITTYTADNNKLDEHNVIHTSNSINSYDSYPLYNTNDLLTCCIVTAVKDTPIQLIDTNDSTIRATYASTSIHTDSIHTPHSVIFNSLCTNIIAGYNNTIHVYDVNQPAHPQIHTIHTSNKSNKRKRINTDSNSISGIVSCMTTRPMDSAVLVAGTYSGQIGLYETNNNQCIQSIQLNSGVTQVKYHTQNYNYIYTAQRTNNYINLYDCRKLSSTPIISYYRNGMTNQHIEFDIDCSGKYLITGEYNHNGTALVYDLTRSIDNEPIIQPYSVLHQLHNDVVSCIKFHPYYTRQYPYISSCSGTRHLTLPVYDTNTSSDSDTEMSTNNNQIRYDNSVKLHRLELDYSTIGVVDIHNLQSNTLLLQHPIVYLNLVVNNTSDISISIAWNTIDDNAV